MTGFGLLTPGTARYRSCVPSRLQVYRALLQRPQEADAAARAALGLRREAPAPRPAPAAPLQRPRCHAPRWQSSCVAGGAAGERNKACPVRPLRFWTVCYHNESNTTATSTVFYMSESSPSRQTSEVGKRRVTTRGENAPGVVGKDAPRGKGTREQRSVFSSSP